MTDEETLDEDEAAQRFFTTIIPGLWVGLLDMIHDLWMRLGDFMEQQSQIYEEVMKTFGDDSEGENSNNGAAIIPFPPPEEETNNGK